MAGPAGWAGGGRWWGWHRLDDAWVDRLIDAAGVGPGDLAVDVGAGDGAITARLLARGARVIAVELHPGRVAVLRRRFAAADGGRVVVVHADAADLRLPTRPFVVVANPPFAVTTAPLRRLTHRASRLERGAIVVPAFAAARWCGGRGAGNSHEAFTFAHGGRVPSRAFTPPAPNDAAALVVRRRAP